MEPVMTFTLLRTINPPLAGDENRLRKPRPLSFDEKMAAEAAFQGLPLTPNWSQSALEIYFGVQTALAARANMLRAAL